MHMLSLFTGPLVDSDCACNKTMYMLKMKGLDVRDPLHFPQNYTKYKDSQHEYVPKKYNDIKYNDILSNKSFQPFFEKKLGYL